MHPLDRRTFLRNLGVASAAAWAGPDILGRYSQAIAYTLGSAASVAGTTLEEILVPVGTGYRRLEARRPGWPITVRSMAGAEAKTGREARRRGIASVVHLTDIHVIDAQSPARVEFLDRYADPPTSSIPFASAQRAQETLTAQVSESMVQRINSLPGGPITGRAFDCAVCTGDNIDNQQKNETDWYIDVLNGGPGVTVTPNSGDPDVYEGVQDEDALTYDQHYWHPENPDPNSDFYKKFHFFPAYPGLLAAAIKGFNPTGLLNMPWYTVFGNHDGLLQGNAPTNPVLDGIATGPLKVVNLPAGMTPADFQNGLSNQDPAVLTALAAAPGRLVAADPERIPISAADWIQAHLDAPGPKGPAGHGFTAQNRDESHLYYTFTIATGVLGISLDTVNRGGYSEGSLGTIQLAWLKARLDEAKTAGMLVVLFSHHNLNTMVNPNPDPPTMPGADPQRVLNTEVKAFLHAYPNVVLWVNGHSHENRVTPHPAPTGTSGFWEVSTAAHVDYPQQARLIEITDNVDGTISIFGTIIEHAAPASVTGVSDDPLTLASISRELSANDYQLNLVVALGTANDLNVELLLPAPAVSVLIRPSVPGLNVRGVDTSRDLPATGMAVGGALGVGAALIGGALALRERGRRVADDTSGVDTEAEQA